MLKNFWNYMSYIISLAISAVAMGGIGIEIINHGSKHDQGWWIITSLTLVVLLCMFLFCFVKCSELLGAPLPRIGQNRPKRPNPSP